jgi:hypothetical protein
MKNEIAPAIPYPSVNEQEAAEFSDKCWIGLEIPR